MIAELAIAVFHSQLFLTKCSLTARTYPRDNNAIAQLPPQMVSVATALMLPTMFHFPVLQSTLPLALAIWLLFLLTQHSRLATVVLHMKQSESNFNQDVQICLKLRNANVSILVPLISAIALTQTMVLLPLLWMFLLANASVIIQHLVISHATAAPAMTYKSNNCNQFALSICQLLNHAHA